MDQLYSKKVGKGLWFFFTSKVCVHNRVPSKQLHYWGSGSLMGYFLEKLFGCWFPNKVLIRHLFLGEILHFEAFKAIWLSKVNGPALLKEGGQKVVFFFTPKVCVHNRVPSKQLHYWGSGSLMGYFLEKLFGCWFPNKVLIRHLFLGEILHFEAFKAIWLFKVNGPALLKEGGQRVVIFFHLKSLCAQ